MTSQPAPESKAQASMGAKSEPSPAPPVALPPGVAAEKAALPASALPPALAWALRENPLKHLATPFQAVDFAAKGYHLEATVLPDQVVSAAEELDREGFSLDTITGVDWLAAGQMEVVYDFFHPSKPWRVVVRARIPRDRPEIPTISGVFPGANWHERETHDFFDIRFLGHPDLSPFLLPEDATYHPLRKDFTAC